MPIYVAIDFGSTNTRVASTENLEQILRVKKFQTNQDLNKQRNLLAEGILEVCEGLIPDFIGVGIHGVINKRTKSFIKLPNYPALNEKKFTELFSDLYPFGKIIFENDAACGALGESVFGAGIDYDRVVYLTLSTGVGGALVVTKELDSTAIYEPGHHYISKENTFEELCSGSNFKNMYGVASEDCNDIEIWKRYVDNLSYGVHNLVQFWSPDVVVIGGGVGFNHFEDLYDALDLRLTELQFAYRPSIEKSELGDDAGLYGIFVQLNKAFAVSQ